jgi:hypothetical protein
MREVAMREATRAKRARAAMPGSAGNGVVWEAKRRTAPRNVVTDLTRIPGVGQSIASDLYLLGVSEVVELRGRNPEALYSELCREVGRQVDRCVLYVFRCAVYFASEPNPHPEMLKWWKWKDGRA